MAQSFAGFVLGAFAVFCLFFFDPHLAYEVQLRVYDPGRHERPGDVAVGVEQPFSLGTNDADTSWYADSQDAAESQSSSCEAVIAVQNRSDRALGVTLSVRYRGSHGDEDGGFESEDGPGTVSLAPGEQAEQTIRADSVGGDPRDCAGLNRPGTLVIGVEACPDEESRSGNCEEEQIDPADALMRGRRGGGGESRGGPARGDYGRQG